MVRSFYLSEANDYFQGVDNTAAWRIHTIECNKLQKKSPQKNKIVKKPSFLCLCYFVSDLVVSFLKNLKYTKIPQKRDVLA